MEDATCPEHVDTLAASVEDALNSCPNKPPVMAAAGSASLKVSETVGDAISQFGAAGMPVWTILAKALPILLKDLSAGKPWTQIVSDILAAFAAGTL